LWRRPGRQRPLTAALLGPDLRAAAAAKGKKSSSKKEKKPKKEKVPKVAAPAAPEASPHFDAGRLYER